jgi:hypothetical protein
MKRMSIIIPLKTVTYCRKKRLKLLICCSHPLKKKAGRYDKDQCQQKRQRSKIISRNYRISNGSNLLSHKCKAVTASKP